MGITVAMPEAGRPALPGESLHLTPIDLKHLRRYTLGNCDLERDILALFFEQLPKTIESLASAGNAKDWKVAAHTLKGSGRAVGAWRIARIAEQAEHSIGYTDPDYVAHTVSLLRDAADEAQTFVNAAYC